MATKPQNYLTLLFPGFQLLDQAGPIDILSVLTKRPEGTNITLTYIAETTEPVGAALTAPKNAPWKFDHVPSMPTDPKDPSKPSGTRFNPRTAVDITFSEALKSLKSTGKIPIGESGELGDLDVLLIPGGVGTRVDRIDVSSGANLGSNIASCLDFVKQAAPYVKHAILTVCTGSSLLAQTGLLDGRRACTNFVAFDGVKAKSPNVKWLEKRRWVRSLPEADGVKAADGGLEKEIWTSAGISAGMDLMLWYVAEIYGKSVARETGRRLEYEWRESVGEGEVDPYYS